MPLNQDILNYYTERLNVIAAHRSGLPPDCAEDHRAADVRWRRLRLNGKMFALTDGDDVRTKGDEETRARFESRKMKQFAPFDDKPNMRMHYYSLSSEDLEDDDALRELGKLAIEAAERAAKNLGPASGRTKRPRKA
ncbi:MAG: TfoX/Sxy family protein [bacterium]|nr:TfoX/Sxy family protein [bacterium]